jgi:hypothetical protein
MLARQIRWSTLIASVVVMAACADSSVAPTLEHVGSLPGGAPRPSIIVNSMAANESSADFTVTTSGGYFRMGKHAIVFPARAICDPATSGYGPEFWDKDCEVVRGHVDIHAELRQQDGREWIDFSPELRFKPSAEPTGWVWIYMYTDAAVSPDASLSILWSPAIGVPGIDESLEDPSLRTFVSPSGYAYRRIKHFSGYNVTSGRTDTAEETEVSSEEGSSSY